MIHDGFLDPSKLYPGDDVVLSLMEVAIAVAVIAWCALVAGRYFRGRPALRHAVYLAGLISAFAFPLFLVGASWTQLWLVDILLPLPRENSHRSDWFCWLATGLCSLWATGTLFLTGRSVSRLRRVAAIERGVVPLPRDLFATARVEAEQVLGVANLPEIVVSDQIVTPAILGVFLPRIVIPELLLSRLSEGEFHDILMHEAAHVLRRDQWVVQLESLAANLFWPILTLVLLIQQLGLVREELCDLYVLGSRSRRDYGRTLLRLVRRSKGTPPLAMAVGILPRPGRLFSRLARLNDMDRDESLRVSRLVTAGILAGFLLIATILCGAKLTSRDSVVWIDDPSVLIVQD